MKRLIVIISLIVVIALGYVFVARGIGNENVGVYSYESIQSESEALTRKVANYDRLNQDNFDAAKSSLDSSLAKYENSKNKYEEIYKEVSDMLATESGGDTVMSSVQGYKINFLQVRLGGYSRQEGIDLHVVLTTSPVLDPTLALSDTFLADLTFTITGEYNRVERFIADLEDDAELGWEINDFEMVNGSVNGYTGVTAKFVTRSIPVDKMSYLDSMLNGQAVIDANNNSSTGTGSNNGTVSNSTTNTTTTPVDNSTSNTVSNTTTNNTVN